MVTPTVLTMAKIMVLTNAVVSERLLSTSTKFFKPTKLRSVVYWFQSVKA